MNYMAMPVFQKLNTADPQRWSSLFVSQSTCIACHKRLSQGPILGNQLIMIVIMIYYGKNSYSLNSKQTIKMLNTTAEKVQKKGDKVNNCEGKCF